MLDATTFEEIHRFLTLVEQPDLFAYLQVERDAGQSKVKGALQKRRSWAQGQQANPKYRTEALWLIKNIQLVQTAVVDQRVSYLQETDERAQQRAVEALRFFIQSVLVDGHLLPEDEPRILQTAADLGVPEADVPVHIELVLTAADQGVLQALPEEKAEEEKDHYALLGVAPGAGQETLEAAYRERYRWARNLRDTEESSRVYAELDAAWRVLKDPDRRAAYHAEMGITTQEAPEQIAYLPPPTPPALETPEVTLEDTSDGMEDLPDAPQESALEQVHEQAVRTDALLEEPKEEPASEPTEGAESEDAPPVEERPVLDIGELDEENLPTLKVDGPSTIRIRTGKNPFPVRFIIRNTGPGQMSGSVSCEEAWVEISPRHLNPSRTDHSIEVLVDPAKMPGNSARATIEIATAHGETAEVVIDALQHLVSPKVMIASGVALILAAALTAALFLFGGLDPTTETPSRTILAVQVDPPAGEVFVDDVMVGKRGTLSLVDSFPLGKPFQVRVELDGFEPWTKQVTIQEGQQYRVEADLKLRDPMDFQIDPEMRRSELDKAVLKEQFQLRTEQFENCFTRNIKPDATYNAVLTVRGTVSQRGFVAAVQFRGANFVSPEVEDCLRRQLRALKLPVIPGDYATFDHTFRTRVGPPQTPSEEEEAEAE